MTRMIYPGTFDPITLGHVDLITRATLLADDVVVAVAANTFKQPQFTVHERVALARESLIHLPRVRVVGFEGLLIDCAREQKANCILRGVRTGTDFDYELTLASMNRHLDETIDTIFLTPSVQYAFISSSMVREVAALGGDVSLFVPEPVKEAFGCA